MKYRIVSLVIGLVLLLSACAPQAAADLPATAFPDSEPSPVASGELTITDDVIIDTLSPEVVKELGLAQDAPLDLISYEKVTWSDASMGCPEPDMVYAQILTEGWLVTFRTQDGRDIEVHSSQNLNAFVMCDQPESSEESSDEDIDESSAGMGSAADSTHPGVQLALEDMASKSGIDALKVALVGVSSEEWPNSCLGCANSGEMCLSVITPGYRVLLAYDGEIFEYHTGRSSGVRLCDTVKQ